MRIPRFYWRRSALALPVLLLALAAVLACSTAEEPAATEIPPPTAAPTAMAEQADTPADSMMAEKESGGDVPDYWKPPTDYYGEPVYGGTLIINYEDPLEHANVWGAASGVTDRYRNPTTSNLVMEDPYDPSGPVIPCLLYTSPSPRDS